MSRDKKSLSLEYKDVFPDTGADCGRSKEVMLYFEGLLPEQNRAEFQSHLSVCLTCGKQLAGLHETRTASVTIVDAGKAEKIFEDGRAEVQKLLDKKYGSSSVRPPQESGFSRFFQTFQLPAYANLLLIALLGGLLYPTYKALRLDNEVTRLQNELQLEKARKTIQTESFQNRKESEDQKTGPLSRSTLEPDLSQSALYSVRAERGEHHLIPVDFRGERKTVNILFSIPPSDFKKYSVEILRADQVIWQDTIQPTPEKDASSLISVLLQSDYFQDEMYRVRIYGMNGEGKTALAEYKVKVLK
jgi:hypothetical protein